MAIKLDQQSIVNISLGGLAGIVTAVATASFVISAEFSELKRMQAELPKLKEEVAFLKCREREIKLSLEHMTATMEQVVVSTDETPGSVKVSSSPNLRKLRDWTSQTDCGT